MIIFNGIKEQGRRGEGRRGETESETEGAQGVSRKWGRLGR